MKNRLSGGNPWKIPAIMGGKISNQNNDPKTDHNRKTGSQIPGKNICNSGTCQRSKGIDMFYQYIGFFPREKIPKDSSPDTGNHA